MWFRSEKHRPAAPSSSVGLTAGDTFRRLCGHDVVETAQVQSIWVGPQGIPHVTYSLRNTLDETQSDSRTLALSSFRSRFPAPSR